MKLVRGLVSFALLALWPVIALAQTTGATTPAAEPAAATATSADPIPAGTTITMQNWQQYKQFMPDGMVALFEGTYYWKMPTDVKMEVGPTIINPLPKNYVDATEKYSSGVKIVELPDGGLTLTGYQGGKPFPNPAEPHKGWKILANDWYRYLPHLIADSYATGCTQDSFGSINCSADEIVYRQLSYNTDPGIPSNIPGAEGKYYTEWVMTVEPEQDRYNASLTISGSDPSKPEDVYVFVPSLRRYQPVSAAARCTPFGGTDATPDDFRFGFDSNLTQMRVEYLGEKRILALVDTSLPGSKFPEGYDMPLGWPAPSWGKWQLRDVDVIGVSKIPSRAAGYCYGKRVMYIDKAFSAPVWEDLYDANLKPWKFFALFLHSMDIPGVGVVNTSGSQVEAYWDIQNKHATFFSDPALNRPYYVNGQAPKEYDDLAKYTTPSGLNEIMR